jgi:hypothetical protein
MIGFYEKRFNETGIMQNRMSPKMNIMLTVNDRSQALLLHDEPLGFSPSWVEFSRDERGVRIISDQGVELKAGVLINLIDYCQLDDVEDVLLVQVHEQQPVEGFIVPFINQFYGATAVGA